MLLLNGTIMPGLSIEDGTPSAWAQDAWAQICLFFNWSYKNLSSAAVSVGDFLAPLVDDLNAFASYLYHLSKNFISDRLFIIWDTITSREFQEHVFGMISYFFAYLFNSYHVYQVLIINFFRIIRGTVGVIFSILNMNNLAQNNSRDERGVGMGNEVVSLGSQVFIITATLLTAFVCCMNPLVLACLATGTSLIYLIKESYFTHKNRMRVKEEKERQKKTMANISSSEFKNDIKLAKKDELNQRREDRFRSKRGVVFAVINLIGAGLMLAGCIWFPPLATLSTYIFAINTFSEVVDRRVFDYRYSRGIGNGINSCINLIRCKKAKLPSTSPARLSLSHAAIGKVFIDVKDVKAVKARASQSDEAVLLQHRKDKLNGAKQPHRKRSNSVTFLHHHPEIKDNKSNSSNPSGNYRVQ